jgi:hypothetical protein
MKLFPDTNCQHTTQKRQYQPVDWTFFWDHRTILYWKLSTPEYHAQCIKNTNQLYNHKQQLCQKHRKWICNISMGLVRKIVFCTSHTCSNYLIHECVAFALSTTIRSWLHIYPKNVLYIYTCRYCLR